MLKALTKMSNVQNFFEKKAQTGEWKSLYDEQNPSSYPFTIRLKKTVEMLNEKISGKKVCDLGCGTGALIPHILKQNGKYTGIDFSKEMLSKIKSHQINKTNEDKVELHHLDFNNSELDEKILFEKSYHLSPLGSNNELGNYFGQSDISQVRFFNKPYDMREMLDIETVYNAGEDFHPHTDNGEFGYWDGETHSFLKEKAVGSIFISEYNQFKENCLVELNCGVLDGKSIKDTSGSGNKGILLGDYSIKKPKIGKPSTRDSYVKTPKTGNKDGAF